MDGLAVNSIPRVLLARALLQLQVLPHDVLQSDRFNILTLLEQSLQEHGQSSDLKAFFSYCLQQCHSFLGNDTSWWWHPITVRTKNDWNLDVEYSTVEPVGLHVQIATEEARSGIVQVKSGRDTVHFHDKRLYHSYKGRPIPVDQILKGTTAYLARRSDTAADSLRTLIHSRLQQVEQDKADSQKRSDADYILMGALMTRYDTINERGSAQQPWRLYMRDYIHSPTGDEWRILSEGADEQQTSCEQALRDIRGGSASQADAKAYRPVYLFYSNQDTVLKTTQPSIPGTADEPEPLDADMAMASYSYEDYNEDEYMEEDETVCKVCHIPDIIDNVNDMFTCDGCELSVHQLCEDPVIQSYEKEIDPWYCRACSRDMGLLKRKRDDEKETT